MSSALSSVAQTGFAYAASYDTHRPSYPPEVVTKLLQRSELDNALNARVVDLGAGTGKFTELLAQREEDYDIIAVEPHEEMREILKEKKLKRVSVLDGSATKVQGIESQSADAVVAAQAFHWFANYEALQEIHRILKPGAALALIWNIEDYNAPLVWKPATKWEGQIKDITWTFDDNNPRFRHEKWRHVFDEELRSTPVTIQKADPLFSLPLGEELFKWTVWLSKDAVWERYLTLSHIAVLKGQQLEDIKKKVYDAMDGDDVEKNEKGDVALHGQTALYWTSAIPGAPLREGG